MVLIKTKRRISPEGKKRIAAAQRARWKKHREGPQAALVHVDELAPLENGIELMPAIKVTFEVPFQTLTKLFNL